MVDFPAPPLREATTIVRTSCPFPSADVPGNRDGMSMQAKSDRVVTCEHVIVVDHTIGQCLLYPVSTTHYLRQRKGRPA